MSDNIKKMVPATIAPNEFVIEVCEKLLAKAQSGELRSIVVAGLLTENRFHTVVETSDIIESIGLCAIMTHRLGQISERTKEPDE